MSVLRDRIATQGKFAPAYTHPHGTQAAPMVMPLALVDYTGDMASYQDLHAHGASGDVNAVPLAVVAPGTFGRAAPSGRP